ncbi:plasmid pRiA4b ORF-3 family protein, partial [Chloroflexota bacterium]
EEPACIAGARACPPEDCGGPPGYEHLLKALADPKYEDHNELLEWVGQRYDPEKFDLVAVGRALKRVR